MIPKVVSNSFCALACAMGFSAYGEDGAKADASKRVREVFTAIHEQGLDFVDTAYSEDATFINPLGEVKGRADLRAWYENLYSNVSEIAFEIQEEHADGAAYFVTWVMTIKAPKLESGKVISVSGASLLRFDDAGEVVFQRDYFDMGEFVYEHVSVLRMLVNRAKKRITPQEAGNRRDD